MTQDEALDAFMVGHREEEMGHMSVPPEEAMGKCGCSACTLWLCLRQLRGYPRRVEDGGGT